MADDLSIQAARSMMHMMAQRTSTEIGVKVVKMQAQQQQAVADMLAALATAQQGAGYNSQGVSVVSVTEGAVNTTL
jgi:hypothetical protein